MSEVSDSQDLCLRLVLVILSVSFIPLYSQIVFTPSANQTPVVNDTNQSAAA
jgi:hypothetical protein